MEWSQVITILAAHLGMFLWLRSESRADYRHMEASTNALITAIKQDIQDFHGRLCAIEERNKKP